MGKGGHFKILSVSDREHRFFYNGDYIRKRFGDIDLILSAGDLRWGYLEFLVTVLTKDLFFVHGNHNYNRDPEGCICIDGRLINYRGLRILGMDGTMLYNFKAHQYTEREMQFKVARILPSMFFKGKPHVVLTHAPPRGVHDAPDFCHKGFRTYLWLIRHIQPLLWLHGHTHLVSAYDRQETKLGRTVVVNSYGYKLISLDIDLGSVEVFH